MRGEKIVYGSSPAGVVDVILYFEDGDIWSTTSPFIIAAGDTAWTKYGYSGAWPPKKLVAIRAHCYTKDWTGTLWLDNIEMKMQAAAQTNKQKLLIQHKSADETEAVIDWGAGPFDWKEETYPSVGLVLRSFATAFDDSFAKYIHRLIKGFRSALQFRDYSGEMYWDALFAKFYDYVIEWPIWNKPGAFRHEFDDSFDRYWSGDFDRHVFSTAFLKPIGCTYPWGNLNRDNFSMAFNTN
jgi:hypothetical protein